MGTNSGALSMELRLVKLPGANRSRPDRLSRIQKYFYKDKDAKPVMSWNSCKHNRNRVIFQSTSKKLRSGNENKKNQVDFFRVGTAFEANMVLGPS